MNFQVQGMRLLEELSHLCRPVEAKINDADRRSERLAIV